jgi:hypothetical protein
MENLYLEATEQTLEIDFNFEKGIAKLIGESYPENSLEFFTEINAWIDKYFAVKNELHVNFEIEYVNSSSHKSIYDLFLKLNNYINDGKKIDIVWRYPEDDEDLLELGHDLCEDTNLKVSYQDI